ncbi:hypothetical protein BDV25DRAFT_164802, partial [Aspergillus avenaceus]
MACFEEYGLRDPLLSISHSKIEDSLSSDDYERDISSSHLSTTGSVAPPILDRNDIQMSTHSSTRCLNIHDHCSSLELATSPTRPDVTKRRYKVSGHAPQQPLIFKRSHRAHSQSMVNTSDLNTHSSNIDSFPRQSVLPAKARGYAIPSITGAPRDDCTPRFNFISRSSLEHDDPDDRGHRGNSVTNLTTRRNFPGLQRRSLSGNSQSSVASSSSVGEAILQNHLPMHRGNRAFTTPPNHSYQASIGEIDAMRKAEFTEKDCLDQSESGKVHSSVHASGKTPRLSLQIHDSSFTRLPGISQTNITGRSSFGYSRDTGSTLDTASPISRSSLDFVFRSRTRTSADPISRAATVKAARQAFEEKEAAKTRKFEEQQMKAEERQIRRKEKHHWRGSLRDDEAPSLNMENDSQKTSDIHDTSPVPPKSGPDTKHKSWKSQSRNTWMLFLTWLRTRVFKVRRKIRNL